MTNWGGRRENAGRRHGSGKYGEPTSTMRIPHGLLETVATLCELYRATKVTLTAAQLLVRHLEQQKAGR